MTPDVPRFLSAYRSELADRSPRQREALLYTDLIAAILARLPPVTAKKGPRPPTGKGTPA